VYIWHTGFRPAPGLYQKGKIMRTFTGTFCTIITVICFLLPGTASAFSESDAHQCFIDGLEESRHAESLEEFIQKRVHISTVASRVGWQAWAVRWNDLSEDHKLFLVESVHQWLSKPSTLSEIDPDAVELTFIKPVREYFELSFDILATGSSDFFTFLIADGCLIVGGSWNNVTMKAVIAHGLPRNPP